MRFEHNLSQPDFIIKNIDTVKVTRDKNYSHSYRNGRTKHGFIYVVKGALCESFFNKSTDDIYIEAGEVAFIPQKYQYVGTYMENCTKIKIVQFDISEGFLSEHLSKPMKITLPNIAELIEAFFDTKHTHPFYYQSCIYNLLWQVDVHYYKVPMKYSRLKPALDDMTKNFFINKPVSYYSEMCGMSEVNFRRVFNEYTGLSPVDYRNSIRLEKAKAMLQSGEYNVNESAEICGFSNISFFIRQYKKKFGCTPKRTNR